jgi:hypothetical protein
VGGRSSASPETVMRSPMSRTRAHGT